MNKKSQGLYNFLLTGLLLLSIFGIQSCKREPVNWNSKELLPLFRSRITLQQIVPDSLVMADTSGRLHFVYETSYRSTDLSDIAEIPDTQIRKLFTIPFGVIFVSAGNSLISAQEETHFALEPIELKKVRINEGKIKFKIRNLVKAPVKMSYSLPYTQKNGLAFEFQTSVAAANSVSPGIFETEVSLSGFTADLTGISGFTRNSFASVVNASIDPTSTGITPVYNTDSVIIDITLSGLKADYAEGYFGQIKDTISESNRFDVFNELKSGTFSLEEASLNISIENGLGADTRFVFLGAETSRDGSFPVALQSNYIGQINNMTRAVKDPFAPSILNLNFNRNNSNILQLLSTKPNQIAYRGAVELNPFGNISLGNDFADAVNAVNAHIKLDVPLRFSAEHLLFTDTIFLQEDSLPEYNTVRSGTLILKVLNLFPLDAKVQLHLLNDNLQTEELLMPDRTILAGVPEKDGKVYEYTESIIECAVSEALLQKLLQKRKILLSVDLSTTNLSNKYDIYDTYDIKASVSARLNYNIQIK